MRDRQLGKLRSGRCPFGARTRHEVPELGLDRNARNRSVRIGKMCVRPSLVEGELRVPCAYELASIGHTS